MTDRIAADGLPARENGQWAETKLLFLETFGPPAIDATATKVRRVYIDLFAGPGINVNKHRPDHQFESGALRILRMVGAARPDLAFTDVVLVNLEAGDQAALAARIELMAAHGQLVVPRDRIELVHGDANDVIPGILRKFHLLDYLLVFADPENPSQWPWSSVSALRAQGHHSVDLYTLLPLEMGIRRLLHFTAGERIDNDHIITAFFGCELWRPIVGQRKTEAQSMDMLRRLEELYVARLRNLWKHADRVVAVKRIEGQGLYRMIFASDHEAGQKIAAWARKHAEGSEQLRLGGDF